MAKGQTNAGSPIIEVDSNLDLYSENPVQNKVVTEALDAKQDTLIQGSGITISNNTISVTDSDKYLKNDATANYAYAIGGTSNQNYAIGIGYSSNAIGTDGAIAIGRNSTASGSGSIAIGSGLLKRTTASGTNTVAIGDGAQANAAYAIQLGSGINNNSGTLQFRSYQLVDNSGTIVDERISSNIARVTDIPSAPEVDNATISVNENDQLQAEGVLNPRTDTALRIWEGTESSWTNYEQKDYNKYGLVADSIFNDASDILPDIQNPILGYGLGKFYLFGEVYISGSGEERVAYTSTDGTTWNVGQTLPVIYGFSCVSEANGNLYAGRNYSTNGITWAELTSLTGTDMVSNVVFAADNCYYVMVGAAMYKSTDGINFTVLHDYGNNYGSNGSTNLLYNNGVFVVAVSSLVSPGSWGRSTYKLLYGADPAALTAIELGESSSQARFNGGALAYGNGIFLYTYEYADVGHILYSSNGTNWTDVENKDVGNIYNIVYFDGYFLSNYIYSADGLNWFRYGGYPHLEFYSAAMSSTKLIICGNGTYEAKYVNANSLPQDLAGCYFEGTPTVGSAVYSEPGVLSSLTVTAVDYETITLSNGFSYEQGDSVIVSSTVADVHPDWLCNIKGVGVKIGNDFVANMSEAEAQVQSDWNQSDSSAVDYIKNKPNLATVATSGSYEDLSGKPTVDQTYNSVSTNAQSGKAIDGAGFFRNNATSGSGAIAISTGSYVSDAQGLYALAIGATAQALASDAIQIGPGSNTESNSLYIGLQNHPDYNYKLLGSDGIIPDDRISSNIARVSSVPTVDQTYNSASTNAQSGTAIAGAGFLTNRGTLSYNLAIGEDATAEDAYSIALGAFSHATTQSAIQLGMGTNSTAHTFQVWNYKLLDVNGIIPDDRISSNIARTSALSDYLLSSTAASTYATKQEVSQIPQFDIQVVNSLPVSDISETTVYLLRNSESSGSDLYEEYIYVNNTWELLGTASIDLTGYLQNEATGTDSLSIGSATGTDYSTAYGIGIELGSNTGQAAFGVYAKAFGGNALALGSEAVANAFGAIQIGKGTNNEASSLYIGLNEPYQRHNYKLLDGTTGLIPADRLTVMTGANGTNAGAKGAVPAPTATDNTKFLRGDGTWAEAGVVVDNSTINKNASNELQAIAVLNKNSSAGATNPLNLWEGTSQAWTNGEATPWYYWQTDVTAMWQSGGSLPSSAYWSSVTYGDGKFVVVTSLSTKSAYSIDGINWTETTLPSSSNWSVTYGDGKFVAIGYSSDKSAYSTDGINWTASTLPSSANWSSVTYGDDKFVAVVTNNSNKSAYSTDGINWTETTMPSSANWYSVTYGDDKFVAVASGDSNQAAYSTDGINWTETTLPSSAKWCSVAYGDGKFVAVSLGSNKAVYSTDGINWTASTLPSSGNWRSVAYGDGKFVATADNSNKSAYSTDGINWTASTISSSANWYSVTYGDDKFVAVALNSDASAIFSISYDKCYTLDQIPTTSTQVYSAPETLSAKTITSTGEGTITLSDSLTYNYTPGGNQNTYRTIGDVHPDWLCNIEGVGVKIGNTLIAEKNSGSTVTIDSSITASSTNANAAGSKAVWDLVSALEARVAVLESQLAGVETQLANI